VRFKRTKFSVSERTVLGLRFCDLALGTLLPISSLRTRSLDFTLSDHASSAMETLDGTEWDIVISGTGLPQSLLALYVSPLRQDDGSG